VDHDQRVPLLCLDLDNTLVDRTGTFRLWANEFVDGHGIDPHEVGWLMQVDLDGFADRIAVFGAIRERYGMDTSAVDLLAAYHERVPALIRPDPIAQDALVRARQLGWIPWLVSNGEVDVQESKLRAAGLEDLLEGWVVSAGVGVRKPDPEIFRITSELAGQPLDGAWMVGDSGHADIAGATNAGMRSVWMHRNRPWDGIGFAPTAEAADLAEAIHLIGPSA
jgi:putative hydrolase of the HAD superfamily